MLPHAECGLVRTWNFTATDASRERASQRRQSRATRRQRRAALSTGEPGEPDVQPASCHSQPAGSQGHVIAAARQALLQSLLAEESRAGSGDLQEHVQHATGSNEHAEGGQSEKGWDPGSQDSQQRQEEDDDEAISERASVPHREAGLSAEHEDADSDQPGPLRKRDKRQGPRGGAGKTASPHSGNMPWRARSQSIPSPPPLAVARGGGDPVHRGANPMATWRVVRPNKAISSGAPK